MSLDKSQIELENISIQSEEIEALWNTLLQYDVHSKMEKYPVLFLSYDGLSKEEKEEIDRDLQLSIPEISDKPLRHRSVELHRSWENKSYKEFSVSICYDGVVVILNFQKFLTAEPDYHWIGQVYYSSGMTQLKRVSSISEYPNPQLFRGVKKYLELYLYENSKPLLLDSGNNEEEEGKFQSEVHQFIDQLESLPDGRIYVDLESTESLSLEEIVTMDDLYLKAVGHANHEGNSIVGYIEKSDLFQTSFVLLIPPEGCHLKVVRDNTENALSLEYYDSLSKTTRRTQKLSREELALTRFMINTLQKRIKYISEDDKNAISQLSQKFSDVSEIQRLVNVTFGTVNGNDPDKEQILPILKAYRDIYHHFIGARITSLADIKKVLLFLNVEDGWITLGMRPKIATTNSSGARKDVFGYANFLFSIDTKKACPVAFGLKKFYREKYLRLSADGGFTASQYALLMNLVKYFKDTF